MEVAPISAMVLVQEPEAPVATTEPAVAYPVSKGNDSLWLACAAIGLISAAACGVIWKRKEK